MGKPRRGDAEGAGQDDALFTEVELVLASMCVAIEAQAIESPLSTENSFLMSYREVLWQLPIERALQAANAWSLAKFHRAKPVFQREIVYPADAKPVPDEELQQQEEDEFGVSEQKAKQAKTHRKRPRRATKSDDIPELLQVKRINEDPLEARWDHRGHPVALRCNVLGEHYAPRSDSLQFMKSAKARPPSNIYQQLKAAVRADLTARERRRIQALNDCEKLRRQQAGELSPEAALEAKFDRLFLEDTTTSKPQKPELSVTVDQQTSKASPPTDGQSTGSPLSL